MYILMLLLMVVRDMSSLVKFDWTYSATTSPDNMKNEFKQWVSSYLAGQSWTYCRAPGQVKGPLHGLIHVI